MPLYFMLLDAATFHEAMRPALTASWRQRSFLPCRALCARLLPGAGDFTERFQIPAGESLIAKAAHGLTFDRHFWKLLVGEMLVFAAAEMPEIQTAPDALLCLLAPDFYGRPHLERQDSPPIQQAHYGTRFLNFGGKVYRPEGAGFNDRSDVDRLAAYLAAQDPQAWTTQRLRQHADFRDDAEIEEELEFTREWFPALRRLYEKAQAANQIVVCEIL